MNKINGRSHLVFTFLVLTIGLYPFKASMGSEVDVDRLYQQAIENTPGTKGPYPLRLEQYPQAFWPVESYKVSETWRPQKIGPRDFYYVFYDEIGEDWWKAFKVEQLPIVKESGRWFGEKGSEPYLSHAKKMEALFAQKSPDFSTFRRFDGPFYFYHHLDFVKDSLDNLQADKNGPQYNQATYDKFLKEFDDRFLGHIVSEWGYALLVNPAWKTVTVSTHQQAHDKLREMWIAKCRDQMMADQKGQLKIFSLNGYQRFEHYAGEWGAKYLATEIGENIPHNNRSIAFVRGAARQYNRPWFIDQSPWFYDQVGIIQRDSDRGHSESLARRQAYISYMSGANFFYQENIHFGWKKNDNFFSNLSGRLTSRGQLLNEWYDTVKKIDRGAPYTPVAVMIDYYHGMGTRPVERWGKFKLTDSDWMQENTFLTFFPNPAGPIPSYGDSYAEQQFQVNTPFGDIVDTILPNPPSGVVSQELINSYSVIVLAGDIDLNKTAIDRLVNFVRQGGILVLNAAHMDLSWPVGFLGVERLEQGNQTASTSQCLMTGTLFKTKPFNYRPIKNTSAIVLMTTGTEKSSDPIAVSHPVGRGKVILTTPLYMMDKERNNLPFYGYLLGGITRSVLPIQVDGDIEFLLNKTSQGWLVTLINNKGVYKLTHAPVRIDLNQKQEVKITPASNVAVKSAVELISQKPVTLKTEKGRQQISITVDPGDVKILKLSTR